MWGYFDFQLNQGFLSQRIVRYSIIFFGGIAIASFSYIWEHDLQHLHQCYTGECFNLFYQKVKFPLTSLGLLIPVLGILLAAFRASQAQHQIELANQQIELANTALEETRSQNNWTNYLRHMEEFAAYLDSELIEGIQIESPRRLHKILFPGCRQSGDFRVSNKFLSQFESLISEFFIELSRIQNENKDIKDRAINFAHLKIFWEYERLGIQKTDGSVSSWFRLKHGVPQNPQNAQIFYRGLSDLVTILNQVCSFDDEYERNGQFKALLSSLRSIYRFSEEEDNEYQTYEAIFLGLADEICPELVRTSDNI